MRRSIFPWGEESVRTKKLAKMVQPTQFFIYTIFLLAAILFLLFFQFGPRIRTFFRILRNSRKYRLFRPVIPPHSFTGHIVSPTTQVVFTKSRRAELPLCVKVWQRQRIRGEVVNEIHYLLEGFNRNQCFAPGVYLGFAYFKGLSEDCETFQYGSMILLPRRSKLAFGQYAYIMKALNNDWRLDRCLYAKDESIARPDGMIFLAKEVAHLHRHAKESALGKGQPESIAKKLEFNEDFFKMALAKLCHEGVDISNYSKITDSMNKAVTALASDFQRRFDQRHIKRCHGDLKLTNLWIRPASARHSCPRLLALDCIDFNPDFYHIDTLSDVAMLVMDLKIHLTQEDRHLVKIFTTAYLQSMAEDERRESLLLTYYTTEKAMICANVCILGDDDRERGIKYLSLALEQATELMKLLPFSDTHDTHSEEATHLAGLITVHQSSSSHSGCVNE